MLRVSLALMALVQSGWEVEESSLAPAPWVVQSATPIDDERIGVIAFLRATQPDGGEATPQEYAIFLSRGGGQPELLQRFDGGTGEATGTGTGFTVATLRGRSQELFRVRLGDPSTLVSLGVLLGTEARGVSCDDLVKDCVLAMGEGQAMRWSAGTLSPLFTVPEGESSYEFNTWGAAVRPDGGAVAIGMGSSTALLSFGSDKVTVIRGAQTFTRPSLAALARELEKSEPFASRWNRAADQCLTRPQGWQNGRALISLSGPEEVGGGACPLKPSDFEFDLATGRRKAIPVYPWQVIDCPNGGWTSSVGTMLTACDDPNARISRMMRGTQPRGPDGAQGAEEAPPPERDLPEAIALSENELFVMEPRPKEPYRWFRGTPRGKGLTFFVDGPSVLTFKPKGVIVEQVKWKYGEAVFESSLRDDWHLISHGLEHALVRFNRVP